MYFPWFFKSAPLLPDPDPEDDPELVPDPLLLVAEDADDADEPDSLPEEDPEEA